MRGRSKVTVLSGKQRSAHHVRTRRWEAARRWSSGSACFKVLFRQREWCRKSGACDCAGGAKKNSTTAGELLLCPSTGSLGIGGELLILQLRKAASSLLWFAKTRERARERIRYITSYVHCWGLAGSFCSDKMRPKMSSHVYTCSAGMLPDVEKHTDRKEHVASAECNAEAAWNAVYSRAEHWRTQHVS